MQAVFNSFTSHNNISYSMIKNYLIILFKTAENQKKLTDKNSKKLIKPLMSFILLTSSISFFVRRDHMNKKVSSMILFTVVFFLFSSCSNVFSALGLKSDSSDSGSLAVVLPGTGEASRAAGRAAVDTTQIETYMLVLTGDSGSQTQTAAAGSTVTFEGVDAGSYTLTGTAFDSSLTRLAYNAITVKVSGGVTKTVAFTLYTTPPIALWSYVKDNTGNITYTAYIADTSVTSLSGLSTIVPGLCSDIIEFDNKRNLYAVVTDYSLVRVWDSPRYSAYKDIDNLYMRNIADIYCSDDGFLYYAGTDKISMYNTNGGTLYKDIVSLTLPSCFAVSSFSGTTAYLYTAGISNSVLSITPYAITNSSDTCAAVAEAACILNLSDLGLTAATKYNGTDVTVSVFCSPSVADIAISGSYLYLLFNYTITTMFQANGNNLSCGALLRFKLDGSTVTLDSSFGDGGKLGWTSVITTLIDADGDGTIETYGQWPADENKGFFGPVKILALKPKKIWLADEGALADSSAKKVVQKDRLVVIDLETETFENVLSEADINFSRTITGSGYLSTW